MPTPSGARHWPALDGLRAVAVLGVLIYHAGLTWLPGGLLGVDVFFVLSGFLITGLLLGEWNRSGRINLGRFWSRRARRLLPALLLVVVAIAAYAKWAAPASQARSLRADGLSTLFYVANWRFTTSHQGYFDSTAPSPLRHTWSLAVEEQFYVVWPLVVVALLAWASRKPQKKRRARPAPARVLRVIAVVGALASAADGLVMSLGGTSDSRLYYGTDTRSQALLVGAALAATMAMREGPITRGARVGLTFAGTVAMAAVVVVFAKVGGESTGLYRGGFLALALAVAIALASVISAPASPLARLLSLPPIRYVGRISYGLYLYHWPLFLVLTAERTHLTGNGLMALRFGATFAVSVLSFHLFEQPIRTGSFRLPVPKLVTPVAMAAVAGVVVATTGSIHTVGGAINAQEMDRLANSSAKTTPVRPKSTAPGGPTRVLLLGDSVAWTFGWNIGTGGIPVAQYGIDFYNRAIIGCGIMGDIPQHVEGKLNYGNDVCPTWENRWQGYVDQITPDVVAVLIGRWETTDRLLNGRWTNVGQPDFDAFLQKQLDTMIRIVSSRGAKVALLTAPVYQQLEGPNGDVYTETLADRVIAFNKELYKAAARHPGLVKVVDFGHVLTPDNQFHLKLNGKVVRWEEDGVHVKPDGTRMELPVIMPQIRQFALTPPLPTANRYVKPTSPATPGTDAGSSAAGSSAAGSNAAGSNAAGRASPSPAPGAR